MSEDLKKKKDIEVKIEEVSDIVSDYQIPLLFEDVENQVSLSFS